MKIYVMNGAPPIFEALAGVQPLFAYNSQ